MRVDIEEGNLRKRTTTDGGQKNILLSNTPECRSYGKGFEVRNEKTRGLTKENLKHVNSERRGAKGMRTTLGGKKSRKGDGERGGVQEKEWKHRGDQMWKKARTLLYVKEGKKN